MNASKKINPFYYHRISTFPYRDGKPFRFHGDFKLAFAYLASLYNKFGRIYISTEGLNQTLGLDETGKLSPSGDSIIKLFKKWGVLTEHTSIFERSYYTLQEIPPERLIINALIQEQREEEAVMLLFGS